MSSSLRRHRNLPGGLTALLAMVLTLACAATLSAQIVNDPRVAEFDPSADHWQVLGGGASAVLRYELGVYLVGASAPFATVDMGKPSPDPDGKIRYDFASSVVGWPLPGGDYQARVRAVGPEGSSTSEPSNSFTFATVPPCTFSLSATYAQIPAWGGNYAVGVTAGTGCQWAAANALPWVTILTASGSGSALAAFEVKANPSSSSRAGTITIGGQTLALQQDGAPALSNPSRDFNGDGTPDLLLRNTATGQNAVWYMNGATYLGYRWLPTVIDSNWRGVATADFNADGKPDIFWRNTATGENIIWYMNGAAYSSYTWVDTVPAVWKLQGVADFNGDGKPDLFWRHSTTGQNIIWYMNGAAYSSYAYVDTLADAAWQVKGVADFNGDGKPDLFWRNGTTGQNAIWYLNNAKYSSYAWVDSLADATWQAAMVADFNGDGKPDVFWRNSTTGQNAIWYLNNATYVGYTWVAAIPDTNWKIGQQQ